MLNSDNSRPWEVSPQSLGICGQLCVFSCTAASVLRPVCSPAPSACTTPTLLIQAELRRWADEDDSVTAFADNEVTFSG